MFEIPVLGICAQSSGMGKTTLLTALLPVLIQRGIRLSLIKQTHAEFDIDRPGKDSYRLREAGAAQVLLSSPKRWVLMTEQSCGMDDERLLEMVQHLNPCLADLVLVEGFRHASIPKIEVFRAGGDQSPLAPFDAAILAMVTDTPVAFDIPQFNPEETLRIADFIVAWLARQRHVDSRLAVGEG